MSSNDQEHPSSPCDFLSEKPSVVPLLTESDGELRRENPEADNCQRQLSTVSMATTGHEATDKGCSNANHQCGFHNESDRSEIIRADMYYSHSLGKSVEYEKTQLINDATGVQQQQQLCKANDSPGERTERQSRQENQSDGGAREDMVRKENAMKDDRDKNCEDSDDASSSIETRGSVLKNSRKSLPLLPRMDQYEKHPLLQTKSRTGITEFEMLMIEKDLLKRRKSMEEKGSPVSSSSSSSAASNRRRAGGSLREPTKLIPRSAHYEPHPLLKRTADGVYELERILHEKQQQQQQQQQESLDTRGERSTQHFHTQSIFGHVTQKRLGGNNCQRKSENDDESEDLKELLGAEKEDSVSMETDVKEYSQLKRVRFQTQKSNAINGTNNDKRSAAAAAAAADDAANGRQKPEAEVSDCGEKLRRNNELTSSSSSEECQTAAMTTEEGKCPKGNDVRAERNQPNSRMDLIGRSCCLS